MTDTSKGAALPADAEGNPTPREQEKYAESPAYQPEEHAQADLCPKCGSEEWDEVYEAGRVTPSYRRCAYSKCDHEWSQA